MHAYQERCTNDLFYRNNLYQLTELEKIRQPMEAGLSSQQWDPKSVRSTDTHVNMVFFEAALRTPKDSVCSCLEDELDGMAVDQATSDEGSLQTEEQR